jgi:hypothetical protein
MTRQCSNCAWWEARNDESKAGARCENPATANTWSLCCDTCNLWKCKDGAQPTTAEDAVRREWLRALRQP